MLLFSMLNIQQTAGDDKDFWSVIVSDWLSIFFFAHCFIIPIALIVCLICNRDRLEDEDFLGKAGTLVEGAKILYDSRFAIMI